MIAARGGGAAESRPQVPSPFDHRHSLLEHPVPAKGFRPSHDRPTGPKAGPDGVSTFHAHEIRPGRAPSIPRDQRCSHDRPVASGRRLPPLPAARSYHPGSRPVLSPGFSTRLPGLQITRRHQGFIRIRPSGLPLARLLPRTERGSLGFFPELRTPTGRTRRRTSGRGSVTNTNRELRDRHRRPPIHELTHMRDIASHPQILIIAPKCHSTNPDTS
jgi:hypothetical protein